MYRKGFTLIELLISILIGILIVGAITSLYIVSQRLQNPAKSASDIIEIQRAGMAQLEWIFNRWGTGTPCNDPTHANICSKVRACDLYSQGNYTYPPPSTLCISIHHRNPCDEVVFYANLYGMAIVNGVTSKKAHLVSCRLQTENNNNCFHIIRYGKFFRNMNNQSQVLIFGLKDLSSQNAECIDSTYSDLQKYNAEINRNATIYNGYIQNQHGQPQNWLFLESGDVIVRVPKRVRLYCKEKDGIKWLMMDLTDMASQCNATKSEIQISPVVQFHVSIVYNNTEINDTANPISKIDPSSTDYINFPYASVKMDIVFRNFEPEGSKNYRTLRIIRYFGR